MPDHRRLRAVVHGRVQGVSFRYYTRHRALDLGLAGYVRNLPDGSVEVVAEGPHQRLDALLSHVQAGPRGALVTSVDVHWSAASGDLARFEVRY